ncbi:MAG: type II toxin-antitoxin system VapC family toxin [Xanthobacteraceae bacterium]|nr:type II toxin-antitoxin system VapC family toxin [Xanthobacteraceae bacterium]
MILPDVNVLIYAFRRNAPHHAVCNAWLTDAIAADARFGMSPLALGALVRVTTQRAYNEPSTLAEAFTFCDYVLTQPNCQIIEPGERHWSIFKRLCSETDTRGRRVSDAWYAALAIEWGCEWVTMDRDFARFPGLKWSMPEIP